MGLINVHGLLFFLAWLRS